MFLTFGFSGHYLDFSLRYPLLMTSPNLQFSRWNVICNAHGYHYPGDDAEIDSDCRYCRFEEVSRELGIIIFLFQLIELALYTMSYLYPNTLGLSPT